MNAQEQADKARNEAKILLNLMIGTPAGVANSTVDRLVDCIVMAATWQTMASLEAMKQASEQVSK
jgi:hypothetical protein